MRSDGELERGVHQWVAGGVAGPNIQVGGDVHGHIQITAAHELSWPVHVGTPPRAADCYQVRADVDQSLENPGGLIAATAVLVGMGGVGKTQVAARITRQARNDGTDVVIWTSASSHDAILATYAEAAERLQIVLLGTSPESAATALMSWLASTDRRWLIVLDDLVNPADMRGLLPQTSTTGRLIVTTRRRESALARDDVRLIQLDVYSVDQASLYLHAKLAERPDLLTGIDKLATELGRLPLAMAQAAAYVIDRNITCEAYVGRFGDKRTQLGELFPDDSGLPDDHQATVDVTWALSVELANQLPPVRLARPLLEIASFLDPNGIPIAVLTSPPVAALLSGDVGRTVVASETEDAIRCLYRLSLVTQDQDNSVAMHGLVQRAVRESIVNDRLRPLSQAAADALARTWPDIEQSSALLASLRANATALIDHAGEHLWNDGCHELLFQVGESIGEAGLVNEARTHYKRLLDLVTDHLGPDHSDVLGLRNNEATWCGEAGDVSGAIERFESLLSDQERIPGLDATLTLSCRNNLAHWRGQAGDLRGAITEFEQLLADQTRVLGADHRNSLITRSNLAGLRGDAGDVRRAVAELEELLVDRTRVLGPDHPDTLTTSNGLAAWRGYSGDVHGAVADFGQLLHSLIATLGAEHPNTLTTRANLSYWRGEAGDTANAVAELERVLAIRLRVQGPLHPDTLGTRSDIAHLRWDEGDLSGALGELEQVLADQMLVLGRDNPQALNTRSSIAGLRGQTGNISGSLAELEGLLIDRERVMGPDHPDTLATRNNIAGYRSLAGDLDRALQEFEQLYAAQVRVLGPDHPQTLATRANLAGARGEAGDVERATQELEQLLADRFRALGPRHPDVFATWAQLQQLRRPDNG